MVAVNAGVVRSEMGFSSQAECSEREKSERQERVSAGKDGERKSAGVSRSV